MARKFTPSQLLLLGELSDQKWIVPSFKTKAATVLSLEERGVIKLRRPPAAPHVPRYTDYECRIVTYLMPEVRKALLGRPVYRCKNGHIWVGVVDHAEDLCRRCFEVAPMIGTVKELASSAIKADGPSAGGD